jgi:hypothetical protein
MDWKQNKQFEEVVTIYDEDTPGRWEKIVETVDDKT